MTSRERVLTALNHREPDRVPIDCSGHRSSGISVLLYPKLREYLGLPAKPIRVYDIVQQLAILDEDVLEYLGIDTIELGRGFALRDEDWAPWVLPDGTLCEVPIWSVPEREPKRWVIRSSSGRVIAQMPDGALYFEQTYYPFFEKANLEAIAQAQAESMWTAIASPPGRLVQGAGGDDVLREGARRLREKSTRAVLGLFGGNLLEMGQFLYRNDGFLLLLAEDPDQA